MVSIFAIFAIGIRLGMHFQKIGIYMFLKNWYKVGYTFWENWSGIHFGKIGIGNGYVFEKPRWHVPVQNLVKYPPPWDSNSSLSILRRKHYFPSARFLSKGNFTHTAKAYEIFLKLKGPK